MNKEEYKAKKLEDFRDMLKKTVYRACLDNKQEDIIKAYTEAFLSQTIEELWNQGKADMIVDLYQMKASMNVPRRIDETEKPQDIYRYHFLMTIISRLCDINNIDGEDIEEAIKRRAEAERMRDLSIKGKG